MELVVKIQTVLAALFIAAGCFFIFVAAVGLVRFPDFYTRMHPAGKGDTLGQTMVLLGLIIYEGFSFVSMIIYEGFSFVSMKLLLIVLFIFLANPTATHAIAKAAYIAGVKPWAKGEPGE
jgi:multicomponent Na+:H+ antiporter subunit G